MRRNLDLCHSTLQRHVHNGLTIVIAFCKSHNGAVGHSIPTAIAHRVGYQSQLVSRGTGAHLQSAGVARKLPDYADTRHAIRLSLELIRTLQGAGIHCYRCSSIAGRSLTRLYAPRWTRKRKLDRSLCGDQILISIEEIHCPGNAVMQPDLQTRWPGEKAEFRRNSGRFDIKLIRCVRRCSDNEGEIMAGVVEQSGRNIGNITELNFAP